MGVCASIYGVAEQIILLKQSIIQQLEWRVAKVDLPVVSSLSRVPVPANCIMVLWAWVCDSKEDNLMFCYETARLPDEGHGSEPTANTSLDGCQLRFRIISRSTCKQGMDCAVFNRSVFWTDVATESLLVSTDGILNVL